MGAGDAGRVIGGRYECVELIGRGGMGEVWRARDSLLQRDVAVKRLVYSQDAGDELTIGRSMREARLAARLNHPNAVAIYDVVVDEGLPCLVMELVTGKSLRELIAERGRIEPVAAARIGRQVAAALGVAHRAGIIHRDVKPANVLIAADGTAKLTDFGIAHDEGDAGLTSTGTFIGTPNFLSPEVALGGNHGPASDVWALGALLYAAVEGEPPFATGGNALAILNRIATTDAPRPPHGGPLTEVIVETMRRDPGARPPAAAVVQRLDDVIDGAPPTPFSAPAPPSPQYRPPPGHPGHATAPGRAGPGRAKRDWIIVAALAVVVVAGIVTDVVLANGGQQQHRADPPPGGSSTRVTTGASDTTETTGAPIESCDDPRTDGQGPAITYVIFAEQTDVTGAQACVKPGAVPESFTRSLTGKVFTPQFSSSTNDQASVVKTEFTALDGTKLAVTCTRGTDGKYLVTSAEVE